MILIACSALCGNMFHVIWGRRENKLNGVGNKKHSKKLCCYWFMSSFTRALKRS